MKHPYDLTNAEWHRIAPLVPAPKPGGREVTYARRAIVNAILCVLQTRCAWRDLPPDFPPWQSVYGYFRVWRADGTWERIVSALGRTF